MRLIFTDLDGTLIDHDSYSGAAARPALAAAATAGVPVIACSSKTFAEMSMLVQALELPSAPLVVENGSAIWFPASWPFTPDGTVSASTEDGRPGSVLRLGLTAETLRGRLDELALETGTTLRGFSTMTDVEVAHRTGLPEATAARARRREYSEPFVCLDGHADLDALNAAASRFGARVTRGGRFFHLVGDVDKGRAVTRIRAAIPRQTDALGLGDAPNDAWLLGAVDTAVVVPQPGGPNKSLIAAVPSARTAPHIGPAGWNVAVLEWLGHAS